jgi:leader peptidase (prepilin peptidase) / N-methyltransferase
MNELGNSPALFTVACGLLGLLCGSFLNVVIYRLPRMLMRGWLADAADAIDDAQLRAEAGIQAEDLGALDGTIAILRARLALLGRLTLSTPRSRCPSCAAPITALQNIPLVSWLVLRGRCAKCAAPISVRYPIVELVTGVLFAAAAVHFGYSTTVLWVFILIGGLLALTLIDAHTMLLPDSITLLLLWLGMLFNLDSGFVPITQSVEGAAAGYMTFFLISNLFRLVRGVDGMGAGDYKLLAALGAWFGWKALLPIVLISAGVGSVVGVSLMLSRRANLLTRLPFGVYLAPAGIVMLFFGNQILALVMRGVA